MQKNISEKNGIAIPKATIYNMVRISKDIDGLPTLFVFVKKEIPRVNVPLTNIINISVFKCFLATPGE